MSTVIFSALTLLVHLVGRGMVLAWLSVWNEVQMICIWFSWCHCHPSSLVLLKSRMVYLFWCLEKRPLNRS